MAITQKHVINIQPGVSAPLVIHCSQGDTGTQINLTVVNGDEEFDCSSYACSVHGVRSDGGNWGPFLVTVSGSTVSFSLRQEMTIIAGPCLAEITIGTVGTANFAILVENATFSLGVTYIEDVSIYQSILNYNMDAVQNIKAETTAGVNKAIDQMNANTNAINAKYDAAIDQMNANTNAINAKYDAATTDFNQAISTTQNQYAVTNARLDTAISAATQDSEVQDIRVKADGTSATTAGNAVREQITQLKNDIDVHSDTISANLMGIDVQENLYPGAADWSGTWKNSDPSHIGVSSVTFMGYKTVYSSESWRRYAKDIPVIAGKTYTFEGWVKQSVAGTVVIYVTVSNYTTNPATVSPTSQSFAEIPANTWVKLKLTFTCTVSGNVSPLILGASGAFYVAKYILIEGASVFSLSNTLNDKATKQETSGIGDYKKYTFAKDSITTNYWNPEIVENIPSGTKCKLIFNSFSGNSLGYLRVDGKKSDGTYTQNLAKLYTPTKGVEVEFITSEDYVAFRIQYYVTGTESNVTASVYLTTTSELGIANELLSMPKHRVFYVAKDGTSDYSSFVDCVNEACRYMDSIVYVGAGTWDIIDEFGENYMNAVSSDRATWGLVLKNRVHLIGTAKTVIKAVNNSESTNFENIKTYFSVFNAGEKGFTLENINIEDENVRYSVHDDRGGSGSEPYTNRYIRCSMIHKNGKYSDCIGAGLGENQTVEIRGCYFEGDLGRPRLVYWHGNNNSQVTDALGKITVCDNYFAQDGTFMLTKYGQSNTDTVAYVSNNSFGSTPSVNSGSVAPYDNMRIVAWNNEIRTA